MRNSGWLTLGRAHGARLLAMLVLVGGLAWLTAPYLAAQTAAPSSPSDPAAIYTLLRKQTQVQSGQKYFEGAHFVGSAACQECHKSQVEDWHKTWHSKMEQWATPATVLGEFDGQTITYKDASVFGEDGKTTVKVTFRVKPFRQGDEYFFTVFDDDDPKNAQTWKIAKTLGGKWDQGYEVNIGDNFYPAPLRYSVQNKGWLIKAFIPKNWVIADGTADGRPRKFDELRKSRFAEAKCQGCHTTGYEYKKDEKRKIWTSAPAERAHAELGISCEHCHGPASKHVEAAHRAKVAGTKLAQADMHIVHMLKDLDHNQSTQVCATCHGRGTNKTNPELAFPIGFRPGDRDIVDRHKFWLYSGTAKGAEARYFFKNDWAKRNRQQWQDFTKSRHFNKAGMSCVTCHSFHGETADAQLRQPEHQLCKSCHTATGETRRPNYEMFEGSAMQQAGVTCSNCHMARIAFRTAETAGNNKPRGDGSSHIFLVPTPQLKNASGIRSACDSCHAKGQAMLDNVVPWVSQHPMGDEELIRRMDEARSGIRARLDAVAAALSGWKPTTAAAEALVDRAQVKVNFVVRDGSDGMHNVKKANMMLDEALLLAKRAAALSVPPKQGLQRKTVSSK